MSQHPAGAGATGVVAGIDVGNATTEVVLARMVDGVAVPLAWDRSVTRGVKGSPASLDGAAALVRRLARTGGLHVDAAVVAELRPVRTDVATVARARPATGRLWPVREAAGTPGGAGVGVGRPLRWGAGAPADRGPVVVLVPDHVDYREAARGLGELITAGVDVVGVLLAADEAVLVANRLPDRAGPAIPVVDNVTLDDVDDARLVALEVARPGAGLRHLADPLYLAAAFGLAAAELPDAARAAAEFDGRTRAVLALRTRVAEPVEEPPAVEFGDATRLGLAAAIDRVRTSRPGDAVAVRRAGAWRPVDDLFAVDLPALRQAAAVPGGTAGGAFALATLDRHPSSGPGGSAGELSRRLGVPVRSAGSEALASRRGALSTPAAPSDALVVDLGGGTVDVIGPDGCAVSAAGAGELLTVSVAAVLGIVRGAAEWVKRGPGARVDRPQVLVYEDGRRRFLDAPAAATTVGQLVVDGPAGLLAFGGELSATEWRALRLAIKREVLGVNLARCLAAGAERPRSVVVVGGPAGDDEVLTSMTHVLGAGVAVGRGQVAGRLGHRFSVAYGLIATEGADR